MDLTRSVRASRNGKPCVHVGSCVRSMDESRRLHGNMTGGGCGVDDWTMAGVASLCCIGAVHLRSGVHDVLDEDW